MHSASPVNRSPFLQRRCSKEVSDIDLLKENLVQVRSKGQQIRMLFHLFLFPVPLLVMYFHYNSQVLKTLYHCLTLLKIMTLASLLTTVVSLIDTL